MFNFNLKKLLFDRDMTRSDLERITKIDYNTLTAYYRGWVKRFNINDMIKICDALDCKLSDLIEYIPGDKK